ncbi:MAG: helix-turn-helix domain-containing protein [Candidatus Coproplasma sp.]
MSFAENLQFLRKRNKITQEELADYLQVSRQSVSKWETGEAYPETEKLIMLCDKFGVSLDELLRGDVTIQSDEAADKENKGEEVAATDPLSNGENENCHNCAHEKGARKKTKSEILGESFGGFIMLSCVIAYLCMGFAANLWHPGWLVFPGGITLCTFLGSFFANDGGHDEDDDEDYNPNFKERMFGGLAAASMMLAVLVFLCLGFLCNLWHPGWVSFIAGGALSSLFGGLAHYFSNKDVK